MSVRTLITRIEESKLLAGPSITRKGKRYYWRMTYDKHSDAVHAAALIRSGNPGKSVIITPDSTRPGHGDRSGWAIWRTR